MSVTFIGSPSVTTPELGDNTERIATTEFVQRAVDFVYTGKLAQDAVGGILDISEFVYDSAETPSISLNQISADKLIDGIVNNVFTTELKNKLDGIERGAQVNPDLTPYALSESISNDLLLKMSISSYDTNSDGVVNAADKINGVETTGNNKYYGTNEVGTSGFYSITTPVASDILVNTTSFNQNLSGTDSTVQQALQTLDSKILGHTIQDEGTPLTARTSLNFVGSAVTVTDNAPNDATVVSIDTTINTFGSVYVQAPTDSTIIKIPAGVGYTINSIKGVAVDSGTCTLAIKINGVAVTGLSAIAVTTTPQNVTATGANIVADGDLLSLEYSNVSSAEGFRGSLYVSV